jgi:ribosomal protein S27E
MRVRHYAQGKFYTIQCPEGTRVIRRTGQTTDGEAMLHDILVVPLKGREIRIPADPPELLPLLAETGNFGVTLVGEPEPEMRLDGVSCPGCGEVDINWLQVQDDSETVHCDHCGSDFAIPSPPLEAIESSWRAED